MPLCAGFTVIIARIFTDWLMGTKKSRDDLDFYHMRKLINIPWQAEVEQGIFKNSKSKGAIGDFTKQLL